MKKIFLAIAMIAFGFLGNAQVTDTVDDKKYCSTLIGDSYVKIYQITTKSGQLASSVRVSATSHAGNHVGNFTADILVNHHQDIFIKTISGSYTQGTIKIESDNNGNYFMYYKTTSSNAAIYYFTIQGLSSELTITSLPTGESSALTVLEHKTNFGTHESGTGGDLNSIYTGKVGIGTNSPGALLHVNNGDNSYAAILANATEDKFSLYTKTLDTNVSNMESFRLGLKYDTNEDNGFISFHRGSGAGDGFLGFSTSGEERVRIDKNGDVGIGTTTPSEKLEVNGNIKSTGAIVDGGFTIDNEDYAHSNIRLGHESNDRIYADNSTAEHYGGGMFFRVHNDDVTNDYIDAMMIAKNGNIGIGTKKTDDYKLAVAGSTGIIAEKVTVKVEGQWPDYVFTNEYDLPTLKEVEKQIKENGHLENIPSAKEVGENGVELGDISKNLLQKVEELTLYTIQQEKKLEQQNKEIEGQNKEIQELKVLVNKLIQRSQK